MSGGRGAARPSHLQRWGYAVVIAVAGAAALIGGWVGEGPGPRLSVGPIVWLCMFVAIAYGAVPRRKPVIKLFYAAVVAVVFAAGWFAGTVSANRAYNACILHGEEVRAALTAYHNRHGRYPATLRDIHMPDRPCQRMLRGGLLVYQLSDDGYRMHFTDGIVRHDATQDAAFIGMK